MKPQGLGSLGHWKADGKPKVAYASEEAAWRAASEARILYGRDLTAYACQLCRLWHLARVRDRNA